MQFKLTDSPQNGLVSITVAHHKWGCCYTKGKIEHLWTDFLKSQMDNSEYIRGYGGGGSGGKTKKERKTKSIK